MIIKQKKKITKFNFIRNHNAENIARKIINESGKVQIRQVHVTPRKIEIIKTEKKPYKLNYKNFIEPNIDKNLDIKINLQNKINNTENKNKLGKGKPELNMEAIGQNGKKTTTNIIIKTEINKNEKSINPKETSVVTTKTVTKTTSKIETSNSGGEEKVVRKVKTVRNIKV